MTVAVILVAAGRGTRFGGDMPKQYVPLGGPSALRRSAERFLSVARVGHVLPVIHADDTALCEHALAGLADPRLLGAVSGGASRTASVLSGLEALVPYAPRLVLIHDAARPFVPVGVIEDVLTELDSADGAFAALPVVDALWLSKDGEAEAPVPREGLWRAQTPQGFHFDKILAAHQSHDGSAADDVAVARRAGLAVRIVEGAEQNFKITTQVDLDRALREVGPQTTSED